MKKSSNIYPTLLVEPTRSGKGVSNVIPTLLSWAEVEGISIPDTDSEKDCDKKETVKNWTVVMPPKLPEAL